MLFNSLLVHLPSFCSVLLIFQFEFAIKTVVKRLSSKLTISICWCGVLRSLGPNSAADLVIQADGCADTSNVVRSLEHVQVVVTLSASQRGKVELSLTSPSGTRQILLARRHVDVSAHGLSGWALMTVHCWGEDPRGNWTLTVSTTATSGTDFSFFVFVVLFSIFIVVVVVVFFLQHSYRDHLEFYYYFWVIAIKMFYILV